MTEFPAQRGHLTLCSRLCTGTQQSRQGAAGGFNTNKQVRCGIHWDGTLALSCCAGGRWLQDAGCRPACLCQSIGQGDPHDRSGALTEWSLKLEAAPNALRTRKMQASLVDHGDIEERRSLALKHRAAHAAAVAAGSDSMPAFDAHLASSKHDVWSSTAEARQDAASAVHESTGDVAVETDGASTATLAGRYWGCRCEARPRGVRCRACQYWGCRCGAKTRCIRRRACRWCVHWDNNSQCCFSTSSGFWQADVTREDAVSFGLYSRSSKGAVAGNHGVAGCEHAKTKSSTGRVRVRPNPTCAA